MPKAALAARAGVGSVRAVERAADVLASFSEENTILSLPALQKATGLARPTIYRILRALEAKGFIYSFGNPQRFQLGYRVASLVRAWDRGPMLAGIARQTLEALWRDTRETVALMVPASSTLRMCVMELKSPQPISFSRGTGYTEPYYKGASGKVLLAHLPEKARSETLRAIPPVRRARLTSELAKIRAAGVWTTYSEVIPGVVSVASPILQDSGFPAGSVCLFGTELRIRGDVLARCQAAVKKAANEIGDALRKS